MNEDTLRASVPLRSSQRFLDVFWLQPATGHWRVQHFEQPSDRDAVRCFGWAARISCGLASLYADDADLWLQFRSQRWSLTGPDRVEATATPWLPPFLWRFVLSVNRCPVLRRRYLSPVAVLSVVNPAYAVTLDALDEESDDFFLYVARAIQGGGADAKLRSFWREGI